MQTHFKKFNIISCLKKTEFSSVYLADHIFLEKRIILKTLDSDKVIDSNDVVRFRREAKILAKLNHPNIIRVLDFGTYKNFVYISFEYFQAQTLRQIINTGKLSASQKTELLKQVVSGLCYVHKNKIIHRDIKPENILVDENNNLKIADFGLALSEDSRALTDPQSMIGTPAYASPEQVSGTELTPASDLFSLGLIAFELFNNYNPILGKDIAQTMNNIIYFNEEKLNALVNQMAETEKIIVKNLLNPDSSQRKIPESLLENDSNISVARFPVTARIFWMGAAVVLILVFTYFNLLNNVPEDDSPIVNKEPILTDTVITVKKEILNSLLEDSASKPQPDTHGFTEKLSNKIVNQFARLQIDATPPAILYINSKKYGNTTQNGQIELNPGEYQVILKNDDFPDYQQDIELQSGEQKMLTIDLRKFSGILNVFTYPWAVVEINGKNYGQTPLEKPIRLKHGFYILELKNPGFDTYKKSFKINGADTVLIQHNFVNPGFGTKFD